MVQHLCTPAGGWSGIAAALQAAMPGDVVKLEPGVYEGEATLRLGDDVELDGSEAVLRHHGHGPAIEAHNVAGVTIRGLRIEALAPDITLRRTPDSKPYGAEKERTRPHRTLVWLANARGSSVENITLVGERGRVDGLGILECDAITVKGTDITSCRIGIISSRSELGIVSQNYCHYNIRTGMVLISSTAATIADNDFWRNGRCGIVLQRDSANLETPSEAPLSRNRCHGNVEAGMALVSSMSAEIADNDCWGNGTSGILLERDSESPEAPSEAFLFHNHCYENTQAGILLFSSKATEILDNDCWGNRISGIALQRKHESLEAPSDALLTRNRCHDNAVFGIQLVSSTSDELADNECWRNGLSGIALTRNPESDAPSDAPVTRNRCHDNRDAGILLISSTAAVITDNDCWGNGKSGIVLQIDSKSPEAPSGASVNFNRCHDNTEAGILLRSSIAAEIANNEFWRNGKSGISLERDLKSPERPSDAPLTGNRCHDNVRAGILLASSTAPEIADNDCWGNGSSGIALERDPKCPDVSVCNSLRLNRVHTNDRAVLIEMGTSFPEDLETNRAWRNRQPSSWGVRQSDDELEVSQPLSVEFLPAPASDEAIAEQIAKREAGRLDAARHGALTRHLEEDGIADAEALAEFLAGPGCTGCLENWWRKAEEAWGRKRAGPASAAETSAGDPARPHRYRCRIAPDHLRFVREGEGDATTALWQAIGHAARSEAHGFTQHGIVTADGAAFDALPNELATLRAGREGDLDNLPVPAQRVAKDLRYSRISIGSPLILDHLPRSQAVLRRNPAVMLPLFEEALLEDRNKFLEAARLLRGTPAAWGWLLGGLTLIFIVSYVAGAMDEPTVGWSEPLDAVANAWLEDFDDRGVAGWLGLPVALLTGLRFFYVGVSRQLPEALRPSLPSRLSPWLSSGDPPAETRGAPWRRWVRQRVFGSDVAVVVVRGAQEWGDDDAAAMRELVAMRPKGRSLVLVLHTPSRGLVDRALLRPLALQPGDTTPKLEALDGFGLSVGRAPEPLNPDSPHRDEDSLSALIGATSARHLGDAAWSHCDILPMLVLGSTPDLPFTLTRRDNRRSQEFAEPLAATLLPYVRLFEGEPQKTLSLENNTDDLNRVLLEEPERATAIHLILHQDNRGYKFADLLGQAGRRQALADALAAAIPFDAARRAYLAKLLACGLLYALNTAHSALECGAPIEAPALRRALAALRAAGQLSNEVTSTEALNEARQKMLDEAYKALAARLGVARVDEKQEEAIRLGGLIACRAEAMGLLDIGDPLAADAPANGLAAALGARVSRARALRGRLDAEVAERRALALLRRELGEAGLELAERIREAVASGARERRLGKMVWEVNTAEKLRELLAEHSDMGGRAQAAVWLQLAGLEDETLSLETARLMSVLRYRGAAFERPARGNQGRYCASPEAARRLLERLGEKETLDLLADLGGPSRSDDLPAVELGYFDPADSKASRGVEIHTDI